MPEDLRVRAATEADLEALTRIKSPAALHRDRIRDADGESRRYLVLEDRGEILGFCCLVFTWPEGWPNQRENRKLPEVIDLLIAPERRSRGLGSHFMGSLERIVRAGGHSLLHLAVDPVENPRAHEFYRGLGYEDVEEEPRRVHWRFTDSDGNVHEGNDWNLPMVKDLDAPDAVVPSRHTRRARNHLRCPVCHRPAKPSAEGWCPRCSNARPRAAWDRRTEKTPIEPEELNGGICLRCGAMVDLRLVGLPNVRLPFATFLWLPGTGYFWMQAGDALGTALFGVVVVAGIVGLSLRRRDVRKGPANLVLCRNCGFTRIGGRQDAAEIRRWRAFCRTVERAHRGLLVVFLFFLVVYLGSRLTENEAPRAIPLLLGGVSTALFGVSLIRDPLGQSATSSRP
jgi:GNAT superfamily N-acetyltransferase